MNENLNSLIERLVDAGFFMEQAVEILERGMIERVLKRTNGNQSEASKALGIHRNTLLRKMVAYKLGGKRPQARPVTRASSKRKAS